MPLLLYCVAKPEAGFRPAFAGVADLDVAFAEIGGVTVFFSKSATTDPWLHSRLRDSAMQFHDLLKRLFQQFAIIPFRFPTIVEDEQTLTEHMEQRAVEYNSWLQKFHDKAQMDVRISLPTTESAPSSGTEFLRLRHERQRELDRFAEAMQAACYDCVEQWRQRPAADGLRASALLDRSKVEDFRRALGGMKPPPYLHARVSGPWPISEFLDSANEE